jgi:hypothetical protein
VPASRVESRGGELRPGGVSSSEAAAGAQGAEGLHGAGAVDASALDAAAGTGAAEVDRVRLARGEITLDQYLDREVVRATGHLEAQAPPAMLETIRGALREELSTDPVLRALASRISAG